MENTKSSLSHKKIISISPQPPMLVGSIVIMCVERHKSDSASTSTPFRRRKVHYYFMAVNLLALNLCGWLFPILAMVQGVCRQATRTGGQALKLLPNPCRLAFGIIASEFNKLFFHSWFIVAGCLFGPNDDGTRDTLSAIIHSRKHQTPE